MLEEADFGNFLAGVAGTVAVAMILHRLWRGVGSKPSCSAAGVPPPRCPLRVPLAGCAPLYRRDPTGHLARARAKLGASSPIVSLSMFGVDLNIVWDPEVHAEYGRGCGLSMPAALVSFGFKETLGADAVARGGALHRSVLKSREFLDAWAGTARAFETAARRCFADRCAASPGPCGEEQRHEIFELMRGVQLEATMEALFGPWPGERSTLDTFLDEFARYQGAAERATGLGIVLPRWLGRAIAGRVVPARRGLVATLARVVAARRARRGRGRDRFIYLDALIDAVDDLPAGAPGDVGAGSVDERVAGHMLGLLAAGHKNPAITAAQAVCLLLEPRHARWLGSVVAECRAPGAVADLSREGLPRALPATHAAVRETLRLSAHAIGSIRRVTAPDGVTLGGVRLPCGALVGASHWTMCNDPDLFPDPSTFDPSRFEEGSGRAPSKPPSAFSTGVHACPGRTFAMASLSVLIATIFRDYDVRAEGAIPEMSFEKPTLAQRKGAVRVVVVPRV